MKSATQLMKNTLLLAGSTVLLRLCALCFQAYLAAKIGAQQLGIFGIISSVGIVFATISISGVRFSVTRLAAEEVSCGNEHPHSLMRCAFLYSSIFGFLSGAVMYFGADFLSEHWVCNLSAALPLKIMALSMPLIALGSCAEGYFTAKQKIMRLVLTEIVSQLLRVGFVAVCFELFLTKGANPADILSAGFVVGEGTLAVGLILMYFAQESGKREKVCNKKHFPNLVKTAAPLAISAYMRTGLSSLGQIIIPSGLRKSGMGNESAFSTYGVIGQMSMPVVMFPAALLNALGELLVPRLTSAQVKNQKIGISYIVNRALRIGVMFSFGVAGIMLFYSQALGESIYKSTEAGLYIRIFAPLIPVIYIDCVTDGCLKGLGQQVPSMIYNVLEGILNVILLFFLLPRMAIIGYIVVMYVKEIFNAVLSLRRLSKVTQLDVSIGALLAVGVAMWGAYICAKIVAPFSFLVIKISFYCIFYAAMLYIFNAVTRDDIKWAISLANPKKI